MSVVDLVPAGISAPVACNGAVHELAWCGTGDGLRAVAHDLSDEDVLRALGGERPPCMALAARWHDYRFEPLLLVAMLTGDADLLTRQSFATVGPPIPVTGRSGFYRLVEPLVDLASPLRPVLAAEAAIGYSATSLLRTGAPDNTSAVRGVVRAQLAVAASAAFGRAVDVGQVWVTDDADEPALFVRAARDDELVLAGKVPVRWAALAVLDLAANIDGRGLVVDAVVVEPSDVVRLLGYTYGRRDPDLTPFLIDVPVARIEERIRARLASS